TDMNDGYRNLPAINEAGVFGTPATILPLEAIAELRVLSNSEAEYGRSAGGVINIVTKSGTNSFHGSGFDFFRNNALDARNFFNEKGQAQNPFRDNQFGGALGGPIFKDKTFFFVDYEGMREKGAESSTACRASRLRGWVAGCSRITTRRLRRACNSFRSPTSQRLLQQS